MIPFASHRCRARARPEQSVDHAVGVGEVDRGGGEDRALIARGERRIAFQGFGPAEKAEFDRVAALVEQPCGDKAVAAVAAGAAENGDPASRSREPRRFVGDRETRPLHELDARRSGRNRKAISFAHFGWRQQSGYADGHAQNGGARRWRSAQGGQIRAFHRPGFCYIPPALIPDSSAGRHSTVNRMVAGSVLLGEPTISRSYVLRTRAF